MREQKREQIQDSALEGTVGRPGTNGGGRSSSGWLIGALRLVAVALLLDVAVETFYSGARTAWVVVGVIAAYLTLYSALLWRGGVSRWRTGGMEPAVLIGVAALAAWLPGGLASGVQLLGQPTAAVLSAISVVSVGVAGGRLATARGLPPALRGFLALVSAYGMTAYALGVRDATPYADLLQGGSLWRRLPFWLQGAFLGAFVIVPFGILVKLFERRGQWDVRLRVRQAGALVMSCLMSLSGVANPSTIDAVMQSVEVPRPHVATIPGTPASNRELSDRLQSSYEQVVASAVSTAATRAERLAQISRRLGAAFDTLRKHSPQANRSSFDPAFVVSEVGRDPDALFRWVNKETALVHYPGLLRADVGVLQDRLGNSLDRATLLSSLLQLAGHRTRLVRGQLTDTQAQDVRRIAANDEHPAQTAVPPAATASQVLGDTVSEPVGVEIDRALQALSAEQKRAVETMQQRVRAQAIELGRSIERATAPAADSGGPVAGDDHWWVQRQDGDSWIDMDPTLSASGRTVATPRESFPHGTTIEIPDDVFHTVEIRVVVERWSAGKLSEHRVLAQTVRPFATLGKTIELRHHPLQWPQNLQPLAGEQVIGEITTLAAAQTEWLPILTIGREETIQASFTTSGVVNTTPLAPVLGSAAQNLGGTLGGLLARPEAGLGTAGHLTAEWIEYEIRTPGSRRTMRREVFDLIGPAARASGTAAPPEVPEAARVRRGLALLGYTEILPVPGDLSPAFVQQLHVDALLANEKGLRASVEPDGRTSGAMTDFAWLVPLPGPLYSLALARQTWSRFAREVYLASPNVFTLHRSFTVRPDGALSALLGFDIVANDVEVRATADGDPFAIRLEQGILDTSIEAFLSHTTCSRGGSPQSCGPVENAAEAYSVHTPRDRWIALRSTQADAWSGLPVAADVKARMLKDVSDGWIVVAPAVSSSDGESVKAGVWWRINPRTGQALGIGSRGWGQSVDWGMVLKNTRIFVKIVQAALCVYLVGTSESLPIDVANFLTLVCFVYGTAAFGGVYAGSAAVNAGGVLSLAADVISLFVAGVRLEYNRHPIR